MLDDYKKSQNIFYNIALNALKNDKLSHAYLIEKNGNTEALKIVLSFIKTIICPSHYTNLSKCKNCNICQRINDNNFLEVKIVKPDGMWIKKQQIEQLQEEFSKKAIEGTKKIYIIEDCEKMNTITANSILKFIEEPNPNIIAILMTNNINQVLKTIISRCQVITLNKNSNDIKDNIDKYLKLFNLSRNDIEDNFDNYEEKLKNVIDFICFLENYKTDTIIYAKKMWHSKFKDRKDNIMAIDLMIKIYYEALKYKNNTNISIGKEDKKVIDKIANLDDIKIIEKIEKLIEFKETIKYNLNMNLLVDNLIIQLGGV